MKYGNSIWLKARGLFLQMEKVTAEIRKSVEQEKVDALISLIEQRQQICDRLDLLKSESGIASWVPDSSDEALLSSAEWGISQEIKGAIERMLEEDKASCQILQEKVSILKKDMAELRKVREASRTYQGVGSFVISAFIDSKR